MAVLKHVVDSSGSHYGYSFDCPGCVEPHVIPTKPHERGWDFDGNEAAPTFAPSILVHEVRIPSDADPAKVMAPYKPGDVYSPRCHSFVRMGRIEFLSDCTHSLAGQTVQLPTLDGMSEEPESPASIPTEPPPPAEGTPLAVPVPSEPPPVIVVDDEPSAGDVVIVEPPAPAQEPAGAPAEPEADPWGLAKHDAHKAELRSRSPWRRLQDEAQERLLTREEFVDAAKRMIEQAALEEYDEYVEEWQRRHPPETTV